MRAGKLIAVAALFWAAVLGWAVVPTPGLPRAVAHAAANPEGNLDGDLAAVLAGAGFTGSLEASLPQRLGRPVNPALADLGRLLFFDNILGLHEDNSCAGCHSPEFGFGDSQSMAIGVQSNRLVGPDRAGPRNMRKSPQVINSAFIPKLMLNGRFVALSDDPFDNSLGFEFPPPEGLIRFPPGDDRFPTLLSAQGHIPQTELVEMAGFTGAATNDAIGPRFDVFDDGNGTVLPQDGDGDGFLNEEIRAVVLGKIKGTKGYVTLFRKVFGVSKKDITFALVGQALSEFQVSLTFANAPLDRFARFTLGDRHESPEVMTNQQKRGALLFFGKARCTECHDASNEMFSDFENYGLGVPQVAPFFGPGAGNVVFDGLDENEDFGREQISGDPADRYRFRTSPIRNAAVQPAFFHNGAFTRLEDAIRHHLNVKKSARRYDPVAAGLDADLTLRMGPVEPVLAALDDQVKEPIPLSPKEFRDLVAFVRDGLLDPRATKGHLCGLVPATVPSGLPVVTFQGCR